MILNSSTMNLVPFHLNLAEGENLKIERTSIFLFRRILLREISIILKSFHDTNAEVLFNRFPLSFAVRTSVGLFSSERTI